MRTIQQITTDIRESIKLRDQQKLHIINTNNISEYTRKQINKHIEDQRQFDQWVKNVIQW